MTASDLLAALQAAGLTDFRIRYDEVVWASGDGDELHEWVDGGYDVLDPDGERLGHVGAVHWLGVRGVWVAMLPGAGETIVPSLTEGIVWVLQQPRSKP